MSFTIFRLSLGDPLQWNEQMGDPVTNQGGAPVPAIRAALRHAVSLSTLQPTTAGETVANRLRSRRQLRSLLNNSPFKLTGYYLSWDDDHDQNGWYEPDQGQLADFSGQGEGLATGIFKIENFNWILAGHPRTHRRAMACSVKDTRGALWPRDSRRAIYSTDFSTLPTLAISCLPPGVTDVLSTGSVKAAAVVTLPAGEDGGKCNVVEGVQDLSRISFEQGEVSRNLGQVLAYDRRGQQTGPTTGPGTLWEEVYGPDYPWSWAPPESGTIDTPVLDNGRCRVRYDATNADGFIIDAWTGTKWEEQGKVTISRRPSAGVSVRDETLLSASLVEYTETRAVVQAVMGGSEAGSREEVFITLQRGWSGPRFEVYPAPNAAGTKVDALIEFSVAVKDTDDSAVKIDGAGGVISATALGTGHTGEFTPGTLGAATFTGENEVVLGRWGAPFGVSVAVVQAAAVGFVASNSAAYGAARNGIGVYSEAKAGYMSAHFGFPEQHAQQALEAETMTLGTGTSSTVDAEGSGGKTATATRTTDANAHVTQATWPNGDQATYRVFARVKTSVGTSKVKIYAKTTATTGATKESAATTLGWVDLGDIVANNSTLEIHAWLSAAGTVSVDRIEAFLIEDRNTAQAGIYEGARDLGQRVLVDSRQTPTLVTRSVT